MANEVLFEIRGQALVVTFNRPEQGNALNDAMATLLFNKLKNVTTDRGIRAVLLKGQGGNFMDGIDMRIYAGDFDRAIAAANQMLQPYNSAIREMEAMEKPIIAAVEGNVSGSGLSFVLSSDIVIAARSTKFNCRFASYGMTPDGGVSFNLARKVGASRAKELLMLGEDFSAEQAEKWGLVTRVVDDAKLADAALAMLDRLAEEPTKALGGIKLLVGKAFESNLHIHLGLEHTYWGACSRSFDFREAIKAYFAKRKAKFMGG